ncbi:hypothetical protein NA78x_006101 [Anatilimnocola sp. NA78]|uniref:hypothetical protein n=1 Tax=Anatilimnocola sp. NA78 TaxID=3415683 RepID=UPI003CE56AF3
MILGRRAVLNWLVGLLLGGCVPASSQAFECELVLCGQQGAVRAQLSVMHGDRSLSDKWTENFAAIVKFYDRDGDGQLSAPEAARLPSLQAMREVLSAGFTPAFGQPLTFAELDANADGQASESEVAACYRRAGIDKPLIGAGLLPQTKAMNAALLQLLDANKDGRADEAELKSAASAIERFDRNDDEMIGAGELLVGLRYPGASGSYLLLPPKPGTDSTALIHQIAAVLLPEDGSDQAWAAVVLKRLGRNSDGELALAETDLAAPLFAALDANRDDRLVVAELATWREQAPNFAIQVQFAKPAAKTEASPVTRPVPVAKATIPADASLQFGSLVLTKPGINLVVRTDLGKLPEVAEARYERLRERFDEDDQNDDLLLDKGELEKAKEREWPSLLATVDRNGDDQLSKDELQAWLALQQQLAESQVLFTLLDAGQGLFELLDTNHDGALSTAELRAAGSQISAAGALHDGHLNFDRLPRLVMITASHGYPQSVLGAVERTGPNWFLAMDRNQDGEISKREFTGPPAAFKKLDADEDERVSLAEAQQANNK